MVHKMLLLILLFFINSALSGSESTRPLHELLKDNDIITRNDHDASQSTVTIDHTAAGTRRLQSAQIDHTAHEGKFKYSVIQDHPEILKNNTFCHVEFQKSGTSYYVKSHREKLIIKVTTAPITYSFGKLENIKYHSKSDFNNLNVTCQNITAKSDLSLDKITQYLFVFYLRARDAAHMIYSPTSTSCTVQRFPDPSAVEQSTTDLEVAVVGQSFVENKVKYNSIRKSLSNSQRDKIEINVAANYALSLKRTEYLSFQTYWFVLSCNPDKAVSVSFDQLSSTDTRGWYHFTIEGENVQTFTASSSAKSEEYLCAITSEKNLKTPIIIKQEENTIEEFEELIQGYVETFEADGGKNLHIHGKDADLRISCKLKTKSCEFSFNENVLIATRFLDQSAVVQVSDKIRSLKKDSADDEHRDKLTRFSNKVRKTVDNYAEGIILAKKDSGNGNCVYDVFVPTFDITQQVQSYLIDKVSDHFKTGTIKFTGAFNSFTLYQLGNDINDPQRENVWNRIGDVDRTGAISSNPMFDVANTDEFKRWLIRFYSNDSLIENVDRKGSNQPIKYDEEEMYIIMRSEKDNHLGNFDYKLLKVFKAREENFHHQHLIYPLCTLDSSTFFNAYTVDAYTAQCKLGATFYLKEYDDENDDSEERKWLIYAFTDQPSDDAKATKIVATLVKPNRAGSWDKDWYLTFEDDFQQIFSHILDISEKQLTSMIIGVLLDERDEDYRGLRGIAKGLKILKERPSDVLVAKLFNHDFGRTGDH